MEFEKLKLEFPDLGRPKFLKEHLDLVLEANKVHNLTAIKDYGEAVAKHIYDCLLPLRHMSIEGKKVLDIGSGAGYPGIVFAIAAPTAKVILCESNGKKAAFLRDAITKLGLDNATVVAKRAEELLDRETFDIVTARAVGDLRILMEMAAPLLKVKGILMAMRGSKGEEEFKAASHAAKELHLNLESTYSDELPEGYGIRYLGLYRKMKKTPKKYPRPYREISGNPL